VVGGLQRKWFVAVGTWFFGVSQRIMMRMMFNMRGMPVGKKVVLGIGNLLMKDDGIGVHTIRALEGRLPQDVELVDGGDSRL